MPTDRILDGVDQTELLLGRSEAGERDNFHYWDGNELQAVRKGDWKLRLAELKNLRKWPELDRGTQEIELYNLKEDLGEKNNVAAENPEVVEQLSKIAIKAKES